MKVKDLLQKLEGLDPDMLVVCPHIYREVFVIAESAGVEPITFNNKGVEHEEDCFIIDSQ